MKPIKDLCDAHDAGLLPATVDELWAAASELPAELSDGGICDPALAKADFSEIAGEPDGEDAAMEGRPPPSKWEFARPPFSRNEQGVWKHVERRGVLELERILSFPVYIEAQVVEMATGAAGVPKLVSRKLILAALVAGQERRAEIAADELEQTAWILNTFGAGAQYAAVTKSSIREAIQAVSPDPPERIAVLTAGWVQLGGSWYFLHATGAIPALPPSVSASAVLPRELASLSLPMPPNPAALRRHAMASLKLRQLGANRMGGILLLYALMAPLRLPPFVLWIVGETQTFKSESIALVQQFFGPNYVRGNLPVNFTFTANALEQIAHQAKDVILAVDDYAPYADRRGVDELYEKVDRLVRGHANRQGRGRMSKDGRLRPTTDPQSAAIVSGEAVPDAASVVNRLFVLGLAKGDVDKDQLSALQASAVNGDFAAFMAGWIGWLAGRRDRTLGRFDGLIKSLPLDSRCQDVSDRTADFVRHFQVTAKFLGEFLEEACRIAKADVSAILADLGNALAQNAVAQAAWTDDLTPRAAFLRGVRDALAAGKCHLTDVSGKTPPVELGSPADVGWKPRADKGDEWVPSPIRVGFYKKGRVNIFPAIAIEVVRNLQRKAALQISEHELGRQLASAGQLADSDSRSKSRVRRTVGGKPGKACWAFLPETLGLGATSSPAQDCIGVDPEAVESV